MRIDLTMDRGSWIMDPAHTQGAQTREFVLSEARSIAGRKKSEAPDRFTMRGAHLCQNVSFPTTPALLMLIFCRIVRCECRNKMATKGR